MIFQALVVALALRAAPPAAAPPPAAPGAGARAPRRVGGFLPPAIVAPQGAPRRVVLLLPDGTPGADARAQAEALARDGALVALLDTRAWLDLRARAPRCAYPAGDLEVLAQQLEKERGLEAYLRPVVAGTGQGASVAWAAAAQGPAGTFGGAVLASPCPDRPLPVWLCAVDGPRPRRLAGGELPALAPLRTSAEVIAGPAGACPAAASERVARALGARLAVVPAGQAAPALAEALRAAVDRLPAAPAPPAPAVGSLPDGVAGLPIVEVPAAGADPRLAILLTGDGGWVGIDKSLAAAFARAGVATVGLDSLEYFWKRRTPAEAADAITRIIRHYVAAWKRPEVLLVGYSRGADVAPFVAARLGPEEAARVRLVALLGPATFTQLEIHAIDLFSNVHRDSDLSTEDPLRATAGRLRFLCVRGAGEKDSLCPHVEDLPWVKQVVLPGGHHFDGDYDGIARLVLESASP